MRKFAAETKVPIGQSKSEIEKLLIKYGADGFSSGWGMKRAVIQFRMKERFIRIEMPIPVVVKGVNQDSVDRESRRRWRAMVLYIKAKLESVESQIVSFEQAFLSHIVLPNNETVGQAMIPQVEDAYANGKMPPLLGYDG